MANFFSRWFGEKKRAKVAPYFGRRNYHSAQETRFTGGWNAGKNSADAVLSRDLAKIRGRSRDLVRNNPYARRAQQIVVNNVVGSGIGMQGNVTLPRGGLMTKVNDAIEEAWHEWTYADSCHTGGVLCFGDFERLIMGEVFTTGEAFVRMHMRPFGTSRVPLALEYIEPERIADDFEIPQPGVIKHRLGVEVDEFGRAVAYYMHTLHPGDEQLHLQRIDQLIRVPSETILHLYVCTRWPQHRGEPWMHATARRLYDMDAYSEAEIIAARVSAAYMGFLKTPGNGPNTDSVDGQRQLTLEPGVIEQIGLEDEFISHNPNRPNSQMDPFMRYMLREVASGSGLSYESLSRDYSQSNYSSSRLSLLDDRDTWRSLQQWFIRSFRYPLHKAWMRQAMLGGAIEAIPLADYFTNAERYNAVKFKPRGWSWVDPTKEVEAFKEAIRAGMTTLTDVIAQTANGQDLEDVLETRKRELDLMESMGLKTDTDPVEEAQAPVSVAAPAESEDDERRLTVNLAPNITMPEMNFRIEGSTYEWRPVVNMPPNTINVGSPVTHIAPPEVRTEAPIVNVLPAEVMVNVEAQPAPIVNVAPADVRVIVPDQPVPVVNVAAAEVRVMVPEQPAPVINVAAQEAPIVNVAAPEVRVDVAPPAVTVVNEKPDTEQTIERDEQGEIRRVLTRQVKSNAR